MSKKLFERIDAFLMKEEEEIDMVAGIESLRKIVAKGADSMLTWGDDKLQVNQTAAKIMTKVYDMLGVKAKDAFNQKLKNKKSFMELASVTSHVALGEAVSIFENEDAFVEEEE